MFCEGRKGSEAVTHDLGQANALSHSEIQQSLFSMFMGVPGMLHVRKCVRWHRQREGATQMELLSLRPDPARYREHEHTYRATSDRPGDV